MADSKKMDTGKIAAKLKGTKSKVRLEDLANALVDKIGGVAEFANKYIGDYEAAKIGSITRARLLDGMLKLVQHVGKKEAPVALDEISDVDLENAVRNAMENFLKSTPIVEIEKKEPGDAPPTSPV